MRKHVIVVLLALLASPALVAAQGQQHGQMQRQQAMQRMQEHMSQMAQQMSQIQERLQAMEQRLQSALQGQMGEQMSQQQRQQHTHMHDVAASMRAMAQEIQGTMMQVRDLAQDPAMHQDGAMREEMERLRENLQGIVENLTAGTEALEQIQQRAGGGS